MRTGNGVLGRTGPAPTPPYAPGPRRPRGVCGARGARWAPHGSALGLRAGLRGDQTGADPVLADTRALGLGESGGPRRVVDVARLDVPVPARFRGQEQDEVTVVDQLRGVDQRVRQVAVLVAEPEDHGVDEVLVVLVHQLRAGGFFDGLAELLVDVLVVADLLDHLLGLETQPYGRAGPLLRVVRGRAHGLPPDRFGMCCAPAGAGAWGVVHTGGTDRASTRQPRPPKR
ncbi:hypothetical protein STTU_4872 [Streptomyces sp. Tu6071]|nr:hypothetical protein STTU_4872 [Streptomyces sp. Tu6071]